MIELKPCPFCGSHKILMDRYWTGYNHRGFFIQCNECQIQMWKETEEELIDRWSSRVETKEETLVRDKNHGDFKLLSEFGNNKNTNEILEEINKIKI